MAHKTITTRTTFILARVKEDELAQILQKEEADGWKLIATLVTIRGLRPRAFHTLVFRKES